MATVYRAEDPRLHIDVAIKVLHSYLAANPSFLARFEGGSMPPASSICLRKSRPAREGLASPTGDR